MALPAPSPAPGKSCGACTLCCKVLTVEELQKTAGLYCPHCTVGGGCRIYSDRPAACRNFMCGWLVNPHLGPDLKPDKCHVVLIWVEERRMLFADCDPDHPDAWRAPNVIGALRQAARKVGAGWKVFVAVGQRSWLITEHAILSDSGEVTPFVHQESAR